jgi:F-type H+-transporting ATPase subunit delta
VDVSEPASISSGIAERYATAVFELAREDGALPSLEQDVEALDAALADSAELRVMIASPLFSRAEQGAAVAMIADRMGLTELLARTLSLMAAKRRLFVLPQMLHQLAEMIAEEKGEMTAEVRSAKALTKAQAEKLAAAIKASVGKDVKLKTAVEPALIGGLVVKVGSKMIDSSIRSKLDALKNSMKEVG